MSILRVRWPSLSLSSKTTHQRWLYVIMDAAKASSLAEVLRSLDRTMSGLIDDVSGWRDAGAKLEFLLSSEKYRVNAPPHR